MSGAVDDDLGRMSFFHSDALLNIAIRYVATFASISLCVDWSLSSSLRFLPGSERRRRCHGFRSDALLYIAIRHIETFARASLCVNHFFFLLLLSLSRRRATTTRVGPLVAMRS